jgi:hypothetical protein
MNTILNKLIESLNNGDILVFVLIITVAFIFNYKKIIEFIDERKKSRSILLTEALNCKYIQGLTKSHLEEELATEQFDLSTGIKLEKEFREAMIQAHKNTNGELSFIHFKRSLPYLRYKDSKLIIKITLFENFVYLFNFIFGFIMAFAGILFIVLPSQINKITFTQGLTLIGLSIFFIGTAVFMIFQTFPTASARYVSKELDKQATIDHEEKNSI